LNDFKYFCKLFIGLMAAKDANLTLFCNN